MMKKKKNWSELVPSDQDLHSDEMLDFLVWLISCVCFVDLSISSFNITHQIFNCFSLFILIHVHSLLNSSSIDPTTSPPPYTLLGRFCLPKIFVFCYWKLLEIPSLQLDLLYLSFHFPFIYLFSSFNACHIFYPFAAAHPTYANDLKIPTSNSISTPVVNLTLTTQPTWKYNIANLVTALLNHA